MGSGIRDKVVILGMGCSKFGERFDIGSDELLLEAFQECLNDAGIEKKDLQAAWLGSALDEINIGKSATRVAGTLHLPNIPVTRVENFCASGTEAFRGACYGVASGVYEIAIAMGVEKLKDTGYAGLPNSPAFGQKYVLTCPNISAPGMFAQLATAYSMKYGIPMERVKEAITHVSWKSHQNGAKNPKAHLRKAVSKEQIAGSPSIAYPLGLFDCCGVSDGCAMAVVTTPEVFKKLKPNQDAVKVKALQIAASSGEEEFTNRWDGCTIKSASIASQRAYDEAGIKDPRKEISMMEVHDCFSITELVTMEDLHISARGQAIDDVLNGFFDLDGGGIPCQVDGGLKCFGHPIGASGLRMLYEMYSQLLRRHPEDRLVKDARIGLTHNMGGFPNHNLVSVAIVGLD
ncbi:MAG: acetyl-CoA acetyltransferase [Actinobacteria bacterium]|jgi:acetyl-CoA C-acetyltransferase|nr:MAG: acetyl-CoA acetyltransferase [Actinomycetota bacterium]